MQGWGQSRENSRSWEDCPHPIHLAEGVKSRGAAREHRGSAVGSGHPPDSGLTRVYSFTHQGRPELGSLSHGKPPAPCPAALLYSGPSRLPSWQGLRVPAHTLLHPSWGQDLGGVTLGHGEAGPWGARSVGRAHMVHRGGETGHSFGHTAGDLLLPIKV